MAGNDVSQQPAVVGVAGRDGNVAAPMVTSTAQSPAPQQASNQEGFNAGGAQATWSGYTLTYTQSMQPPPHHHGSYCE